jgi:NADH-quinone oxidoreductase subunit J
MTINTLLLAALVLAATWTVVTPSLLRSVVGLAVTSAVVTVLLFRLDSPLAGVFELSVCAGLIPAIFLIAISLTSRLSPEAVTVSKREQIRKFWCLPVILLVVGVALSQAGIRIDLPAAVVGGEADVRKVLWEGRHLDLLGQIVILLAGAFGVVALLREPRKG